MNRPDPQPDLVLFDLDDTLCDYAGARIGRLRIAFTLAQERAGVHLTAPIDDVIAESLRIQEHGVDHFPDVLSRYGISDHAAAEKAAQWFVHHRFHGLQLFPDAIETLQTIRAAKPRRRLGLVTNGPAEVQSAKIDLLGIRSYFDFCLISGEYGYWKPERQIFQAALDLGHAPPDDTVMIGDSPQHDMAGAEALSISTIWMNRQQRSWPIEIPAPTYTVHDLSMVRKLLAG